MDIFKNIISKWPLLFPLIFIFPIFWHRTNKIILPIIPLNPVLITYGYKSICGLIGTIVVFGLFSSRHNFNKFILIIGRNTLSIYAMNFIFINWIGFVTNFIKNIFLFYLIIGVLTFLVIVFCLIIQFYLKKNKMLGILFLGNNFK